MRIAVQMDPIEKMIVNHDTSLALMVEAQARGHELWWWAPSDLFYELGVVKARTRATRWMFPPESDATGRSSGARLSREATGSDW